MPDRTEREERVIQLISRMFPRESIGDKFEDKVVELDSNELALIAAWLAAKDMADIVAKENNVVDRAFIGALFMLQAIHSDEDVAAAIVHYPPLDVWRKLVANFLLSLARESDDFLTRAALPRSAPSISDQVEALSDEDIRRFLLDVALLVTKAAAEVDGWWGREFVPVISAVIVSEICRQHPFIWDMARKVPAMSLLGNAVLSLLTKLRAMVKESS